MDKFNKKMMKKAEKHYKPISNVAEKIGTVLITGGLIIGIGSAILNLGNGGKITFLDRKINLLNDEIKNAESYKAHEFANTTQLYEAYKAGEIDSQTFQDCLADMSTNEYIYENREEVATAEQVEELESLYAKKATTQKTKNILQGFGIAGASAAGLSLPAFYLSSYLKIKEELER